MTDSAVNPDLMSGTESYNNNNGQDVVCTRFSEYLKSINPGVDLLADFENAYKQVVDGPATFVQNHPPRYSPQHEEDAPGQEPTNTGRFVSTKENIQCTQSTYTMHHKMHSIATSQPFSDLQTKGPCHRLHGTEDGEQEEWNDGFATSNFAPLPAHETDAHLPQVPWCNSLNRSQQLSMPTTASANGSWLYNTNVEPVSSYSRDFPQPPLADMVAQSAHSHFQPFSPQPPVLTDNQTPYVPSPTPVLRSARKRKRSSSRAESPNPAEICIGTTRTGLECAKKFRKTEDPQRHRCQTCYKEYVKSHNLETEYVFLHGVTSYKVAEKTIYPPVTRVKLEEDDAPNIDDYTYQGHLVEELLEAVNTPYVKNDEFLRRVQKTFNAKRVDQPRRYNNGTVNAHLWLLLRCLLVFHHGGPNYPYSIDGDNAGHGPPNESLKFTERFSKILEAFKENKQLVMNTIEGRAILALVWNPDEVCKRKDTNKNSNTTKGDQIRKGQQRQHEESTYHDGEDQPASKRAKRKSPHGAVGSRQTLPTSGISPVTTTLPECATVLPLSQSNMDTMAPAETFGASMNAQPSYLWAPYFGKETSTTVLPAADTVGEGALCGLKATPEQREADSDAARAVPLDEDPWALVNFSGNEGEHGQAANTLLENVDSPNF